MGRRWRLGEQERRERGPRGSRWRLGERERREWVVEACWHCGNHERRGLVRRGGGGAGALPSAGLGLVGRLGPVRRRRRVLGGLARRRFVLEGLVGVRWRQLVVVRVGSGPGGPLCVDWVARDIRWLVRVGWPLVVGRVCRWSTRWLPSHTLVLFVHGGLWPGGVGWWAVVVVGVVLVVVVVGPLVVVALVVVGSVLRVRP